MFGDNDIEIVDAQKAAQGTEVKPTVAASEEPAAKEDEEEEEKDEDDEPGGKSNDPVRLYLRKMGSVSLLTREGEVEIAKRIEEGEKEVLRALLACQAGGGGDPRHRQQAEGRQAAHPRGGEGRAGGAERRGRGRGRRATPARARGAAQLNQSELNRIEQICKQIEKIRKYAKDCEALEEELGGKKKLSEVKRKEVKQEIKDLRTKMMEVLEEMRLNKKQIDRIVCNLRGAHRAGGEGRGRAARDGARAAASPMKELRPLLREARENPATAKKLQKRLNVTPEQLEARRPRRAHRGAEDQAGRGGGQPPGRAAAPQLRGDPRRRAQGRARQEPSWWRPTSAWWCRSRRSTPTAACSSST